MSKFLILFNHVLTDEQELDAVDLLGVDEFCPPPVEVSSLWKAISPEEAELRPLLEPVFTWIEVEGEPGDYLLVQGDFGATCMVVEYAIRHGLTPVYATTRRITREQENDDGSVEILHRFHHVRFREYGK